MRLLVWVVYSLLQFVLCPSCSSFISSACLAFVWTVDFQHWLFDFLFVFIEKSRFFYFFYTFIYLLSLDCLIHFSIMSGGISVMMPFNFFNFFYWFVKPLWYNMYFMFKKCIWWSLLTAMLVHGLGVCVFVRDFFIFFQRVNGPKLRLFLGVTCKLLCMSLPADNT